MNKLDHLIQSVDRLVELNVELLNVIRGGEQLENSCPPEPTKKIDIDYLNSLLYSKQVIAILKISSRSLSRYIKDKFIKPIKVGRQNRFDPAEVDKLINIFMK